ncbi:hypothetical protein [Phenylobacterium sp. J367]|uniref:DUF7662 domain-containing protein n=1 Tax=Phenylobacterium sp. J367 TaxID=2898435 RepID=UPI0021519A09|nr:hypothetical protein [Phenylobacterium sp. J367]MCR5880979.1 hypothetical protein [Phenylobacterium sp. J367]
MKKYQPLSERLAGHEGPEWQASFAEIEEVLGFPLPKVARSGRAWWADAEKPHAKTWSQHGFQAHVDPGAAKVSFRRSDIAAAPVAAVLAPVGEIAAEQVKAEPESEPPKPPSAALAPSTPGAPPAPKAGVPALGIAALVAGGVALLAGMGALAARRFGRRA